MRRTTVAGLTVAALALLPVGAVPLAAGAPTPPEPPAPVEAMVLESLETDGTADIWVDLEARADLSATLAASGWDERGQAVYDALTATASASQRELRARLDAEGADYQSFFISNVIHVEDADRATVTSLASRPEVAQITASDTLAPPPEPTSPAAAPQALSWGVRDIGADRAWQDAGTRGEGIVVGLIDTGVQWDHPALRDQYRGTRGGRVNHDYAWFDATGGGAPAPVDSQGHGTHVAGTLVGDDSQGNQIGVAPGAEWIAANGCTALCTDAQLLASAEWMLAPTRVDGSDPDPARRPDIVNSSWGSVRPANNTWFDDSIRAWHAAGIADVFSNGNHGTRGCRSSGAPGSTSLAYSVGNYQRDHGIADTSSRGSGAGGNRKPNVAAPGTGIVSAAPGGGYATKSGTSMAAPHVAGAIALLWSARPALIGEVSRTRAIMDRSATDTTDLTCGGTDEDNNVFGEGRIDVPALLAQAERWSVDRWSGDGRYETAARIAARYPAGVRTVYLVAGGGGDTSYADAVAVASAAAGDVVGAGSSAPVLLIDSQRQRIPDPTRQALSTIDPQRVVLLGGTRSIAPKVQRQLAGDYAVTRIDGRAGFPGDRYATAADLAHRFPRSADRVYVASGANLADALAGGALAGRDDAPLLLVRQDQVPAATQEALDRFPDAEVVVLGGTSSVSERVRRAVGARPGDRVAGPNRYATAWLIADRFGSAREAFVAGGQDAALIDAVTGSALAGSRGEPMLITPGTARTAPGALLEQAVRMGAERLVVLGGPASVSEEIRRDLAD